MQPINDPDNEIVGVQCYLGGELLIGRASTEFIGNTMIARLIMSPVQESDHNARITFGLMTRSGREIPIDEHGKLTVRLKPRIKAQPLKVEGIVGGGIKISVNGDYDFIRFHIERKTGLWW